MASKDDIIALPNPHLRERSKKVGVISDEIREIIAEMEEASLDWEDSREHEVTVALAAIQIDKPIRIVVVRNNFDDKKDRRFFTLINPEITKLEGEIEEDFEGCLSVNDVYGKIPRHTKVRVKALDANGREIRITAEGFLARIMQHEIDHTNGIVIIDRIRDSKDSFYRLNKEGKLDKLDYDTDIKDSNLWPDNEEA